MGFRNVLVSVFLLLLTVPAAAQTASPAWQALQAQTNSSHEAQRAQRDKQCETTRHERSERLKYAIVAHLKEEGRLFKIAPAIRKACKYSRKATGAFTVSGTTIEPQVQETITCGKLPKGVSKEDVDIVMPVVAEAGRTPANWAEGRILQSSDRKPEDEMCTESDKAAGLDWNAVEYGKPITLANTNAGQS